jgi:hypothetical protein
VRSQRGRRRLVGLAGFCAYPLLAGAACGPDDPPEHPQWADVEPIVRAECAGCHGASAAVTGAGYRFDFYDMPASICGDAAAVLADVGLARAQADNIARAITTTDPDIRPIMPPVPAPYLTDNEWTTILRWTANPIKGDKPPGNRAPEITVAGTPATADKTLDVNLIVSDRDGDAVVGRIQIGAEVARMDRSGAFSGRYDTSSWPEGVVKMNALLCDGWTLVSVDLLDINIHH